MATKVKKRTTLSKGKRMPGVKRPAKLKLKKKKPKGTKLRLATMQDRCTNVQNLNKVTKMMKDVGRSATAAAMTVEAVKKFLKKLKDHRNQSKKFIMKRGNTYCLQKKRKKTEKGSTTVQDFGGLLESLEPAQSIRARGEDIEVTQNITTTTRRTKAAKAKTKAKPKTKK